MRGSRKTEKPASSSRTGDWRVTSGLEAETFELDGLQLVVFEMDTRPLVPTALTAAERDVAWLVCKGHTMTQIAEQRRTRYRTIANQLAAIYRKLDVHSSAELTALLLGTRPVRPR